MVHADDDSSLTTLRSQHRMVQQTRLVDDSSGRPHVIQLVPKLYPWNEVSSSAWGLTEQPTGNQQTPEGDWEAGTQVLCKRKPHPLLHGALSHNKVGHTCKQRRVSGQC